MTHLWVLYDSSCPFCVWCRRWLESRAQLVPLRFSCCRSDAARQRFGGLPLVDELVVVDPSGRWWAGPPAFAMCLWALEDWRDLAMLLTADEAWWLVREVFAAVSANRATLSTFVGEECRDGACATPHPAGAYR